MDGYVAMGTRNGFSFPKKCPRSLRFSPNPSFFRLPLSLFHLSSFCFFSPIRLSLSSLPHILALSLSSVLSLSSLPLSSPLSLIICLFNTHLYSILFPVVMAISWGCVGENERANERERESGCFGSDISWAVTLFPVCRFGGWEL